MRSLLGIALFVIGALVFSWGVQRNTATGGLGDFVSEGFEDGSIWLCIGGALVAVIGLFSYFNTRLGRAREQP